MVRIFSDKMNSEFIVQTTALDVDTFVSELSEAISDVTSKKNDGGIMLYEVMRNAMPIAFKLAGYKADGVSEQRTLVCGTVSPEVCEVIVSVGR